MKKKYTLMLFFSIICFAGFSKTWTISNSGSTFNPDTLIINLGDSVKIIVPSSHNAVEVTQSTWQSNGNTSLSGGFETEFGGGLVLPTKLTEGTHWFVCSAHANFGMKGVIIVNAASAIQENMSEPRLSIFPNPATSYISVTYKNEIIGSKYFISNIVGNQILKGTLGSAKSPIDIRELPKGIYFLQISGQERLLVKFIKN